MRSPYILFLTGVAKIVDGRVPKHYDLNLKRYIQLVLFISMSVSVSVAVFFTGSDLKQLFVISTVTEMVPIGFALVAITNLAMVRKNSIINHSVHMTVEQFTSSYSAGDDSVAEGAVMVYDYLKVFAAVLGLLYIPVILYPVIQHTIFLRLQFMVYPLIAYYQMILIFTGLHLGSRWFKNDSSQSTSETTSTE